MADSLNTSNQDMEANYIYNSSGAISVNVNEGYMDQAFGGAAAAVPAQKPLELPNVVFFGPLQGLIDGVKNLTSDTNLREPKEKPASGNFFDQPGKTIDGKKIGKMR